MIQIKRKTFLEIISQARRELPNEACGCLFGHGETVEENYPMTNADHSPEHFSFVPQEQFAALRQARRKGLSIIGNWHSHPSTPSRPSDEDIRLAYDPSALYLILSLASGEPVLNAFRIINASAEKLPISIVE